MEPFDRLVISVCTTTLGISLGILYYLKKTEHKYVNEIRVESPPVDPQFIRDSIRRALNEDRRRGYLQPNFGGHVEKFDPKSHIVANTDKNKYV